MSHDERYGRYYVRLGTPLSPREAEFLRLMCEGCESMKIAGYRMGVSHNTLGEYVKRIKIRTGAKNWYQIGIWARDNGYADPLPRPIQDKMAMTRDIKTDTVPVRL